LPKSPSARRGRVAVRVRWATEGGIISGKLERGAVSFITDGWGEGIACWLSNGSTNEETFVHVRRHC
jgi:hypothetical protein